MEQAQVPAYIEIGSGGNVVVFADEKSFEHKPAPTEGVTVDVADDGHLIIYTNGTVTSAKSLAEAAAAKAQAEAVPEVASTPGQKMADGTFYLGRFREKDGTEKDYFAAAEDAHDKYGIRLFMDFRHAARNAKKARDHGHKDWIVPPAGDERKGEPNILRALFKLRAVIGLDVSVKSPGNCYWSATPHEDYPGYMKIQRMKDGPQFYDHRKRKMPARLVRSVAV